MAKRGQLTQQIVKLAKELLDREISQTELRLMPYAQYCLMNGQQIEPQRINSIELEILSCWRERGFIEGGAPGFAVSKEFWDALNQILWFAYVDYEQQPDD